VRTALKSVFTVSLVLALGGLAACSGTKEKLGLAKRSPDEFAVVKRAPLQMPPDYGLRPPRPGAARPQEQAASDVARAAVLGQEKGRKNPSGAEAALLRETGGDRAPPDIRGAVDSDSPDLSSEPVVKKIFGLGGSGEDEEGKTLDPAAEAARLKTRKATGAKP
jgi:hypothetical protein